MTTKAQILSDLEHRGIDAFLAEMSTGFKVPECFIKRICKIVLADYGIKLTSIAKSDATMSGAFCSMPYTNEFRITLINEVNI
jgi:hypothetical protein